MSTHLITFSETSQDNLSIDLNEDDSAFDDVLKKLESHMEREISFQKTFRIGWRHIELTENDKIF